MRKLTTVVATICNYTAAAVIGTAGATTGTVLFNPVSFPTETCAFSRVSDGGGKAPMSGPISGSDAYAIGHDGTIAKVYLIFMGPQWWDSDHNKEVPGVDAIVESVNAILSSPYLTGITQYGSNGLASYAGYWIDIYNDGSVPPWSNSAFCYPHFIRNGSCLSNNPMYFEAKNALAAKPGWAPSVATSGDARDNPIFVEIHYGGGGGGNDSGYTPQPTDLQGYHYLPYSVNYADIAINSVNDLTSFSAEFTHEIVERMSTGGIDISYGLLGGQCTNASQIADGEPNLSGPNYVVGLADPGFPNAGGSGASVTSAAGGLATVSGLSGLSAANVGGNLYLSGAANVGNNGGFQITSVQSSTSVTVADPVGVAGDANNGRIQWGTGPWVQAYWSVVDQAFIVPGGFIPDGRTDTDARVLLDDVWNTQTAQVLLRQGQLAYFGRPYGYTPIDPTEQMAAYAIDVDATGANNPNIYGLTAGGQIRKFTGNPWPSYTNQEITPQGYAASQVVAPRASLGATPWGPVGSGLYIVASNNGVAQVWKYTGAGQSWTALTGTNTTLYGFAAIAADVSGQVELYIMADNGPHTYVWQYLSGTNWRQITDAGTTVVQIAAANNNLYMLSSNGGSNIVSVWNNPGQNWTPVSSGNWSAGGLWVAGDLLFTMFNNEIYEYVPGADASTAGSWISVTGSNSVINQLLTQDAAEFFINASNGGGYQTWQFQGIASQGLNTTFGWIPLTDLATFQLSPGSLFIGPSDTLDMNASKNGSAEQTYHYGGSPNSWQTGP